MFKKKLNKKIKVLDESMSDPSFIFDEMSIENLQVDGYGLISILDAIHLLLDNYVINDAFDIDAKGDVYLEKKIKLIIDSMSKASNYVYKTKRALYEASEEYDELLKDYQFVLDEEDYNDENNYELKEFGEE